jgi:hypothetical protein
MTPMTALVDVMISRDNGSRINAELCAKQRQDEKQTDKNK